VKDPFRTAWAARLLPAASRVRVVHLGAALSEDMEAQARAEQAANPRYRWLGERPRGKALRILARCRLLSLTSLSEGGANAISEAVTLGVPVLASRIAGSIGLLGEDYPGYFPVQDTQALAELLLRVETDRDFYAELGRRCEALRPLFTPDEERRRWQALLGELAPL
jgi:glycosyltransferase involved in cell wall biosynthesis